MSEASLLQKFKQIADKEPSVVHLLDPLLIKLCLTWHSGLCERRPHCYPTDAPPAVDTHHLWSWLWSRHAVHYDRWVRLAGLPVEQAYTEKARNLIDTRLVYPDGTIHTWVKRTLDAQALARYQSMASKLQAKKKKDAEQVPVEAQTDG
jgi:hypothetical protein